VVDVAALVAVGISAENMHVAGSFQGWNPGVSLMTDPGNATRSITLPASPGLVEYKFLLSGDWSGAENVPELCGVDNGLGSFNRSFVVPSSDITLSKVCFSGCYWCNVPPISCAEDINEDGLVSVSDLMQLLGSFGNTCSE
jgi:hypothetical protein